LDTQWVRRLTALVGLAQRAGGWLAVLLGLGVLLVVGNTIRLHVEKRKDEIQITQLFGATDAFIQRPFVYSGLVYGLLGALIATVLLTGGQLLLHGAVERLAVLYGSPFRLIGWNIRDLVLLLVSGAGLGMGGSWLAVHRHIRALDI
jgi:cell division transport system permease protein